MLAKETAMLEAILESEELQELLAQDFDLAFNAPQIGGNWFDIKSNDVFFAIAKNSSGGLFLSGNKTGRILYLSSEGQAGVVAASLLDFLQLLLTHPYWLDLLKFSGGGKISEMEKSIPFLKEEFSDFLPEISESCRIISRQLGIDPDNTSLQKLHSAVSSGGSDISVASKDGTTCSSLFNSFTVESNPMWKQA